MTFPAVDAGQGGSEESGVRPPPPRNPFVHELELTLADKLRIGLMSVTVFPVRLLLVALFILLAWPFAFAASLGRSRLTVETQSWWRRLMETCLRAIMRVIWFCGGFHRIKVKGEQAAPSEAPILILAPHSSFFDCIPVTVSRGSVVVKLELGSIPVLGTILNFIRPVFVSRSDQDSRRKTVDEIKRRVCSGGEWPQIMIFPEATCTNRSGLIRFKPGAFIPGVPVQPVVLCFPNKLDTVTWTWRGPGMFKVLWLTLCQLHNPVEMEYLPVYAPSEEEKSDPALFAHNVRRIMAEALRLPVSDLSMEDCQLSVVRGPLRIPADSSLLDFNKLVNRLGLRTSKMTDEVLQRQASRARNLREEDTMMGLEDMARYLDLPVTDMLSRVHRLLLDPRGDGRCVDIRRYVIALSVVCRPSRSRETLALAFRMYESWEDRAVTREDLDTILKTALGVAELDFSALFAVLDPENTGRFTCDWLCAFMERHPDFAQEYVVVRRRGVRRIDVRNRQTHTKKDD